MSLENIRKDLEKLKNKNYKSNKALEELENQVIDLEDIIFQDKIIKPGDITDNILNNLKQIKFHNLSEEQSVILNSVIRKTLEEVREDNIDREVALAYDLNGYKNYKEEWLFKTVGESDTDQLDLAASTDINHLLNVKMKSAVVISHNHPKNRIISILDFKTFCNEPNMFILVAITNSGHISYIVKDEFDYKEYLNVSKEILLTYKVKTSDDVFLVDLLNNCERFGIKFFKEV